MPELMRFIATRLRHFVANRRSAKRFTIRFHCTIGVGPDRAGGTQRDASLEGYTSDLSATGLALLIPAIHINGRYVTGAGNRLFILIEPPEAPILLQGVAERYERLEQDEAEMRYLIGVRITEISDEDRARLLTLVK